MERGHHLTNSRCFLPLYAQYWDCDGTLPEASLCFVGFQNCFWHSRPWHAARAFIEDCLLGHRVTIYMASSRLFFDSWDDPKPSSEWELVCSPPPDSTGKTTWFRRTLIVGKNLLSHSIPADAIGYDAVLFSTEVISRDSEICLSCDSAVELAIASGTPGLWPTSDSEIVQLSGNLSEEIRQRSLRTLVGWRTRIIRSRWYEENCCRLRWGAQFSDRLEATDL